MNSNNKYSLNRYSYFNKRLPNNTTKIRWINQTQWCCGLQGWTEIIRILQIFYLMNRIKMTTRSIIILYAEATDWGWVNISSSISSPVCPTILNFLVYKSTIPFSDRPTEFKMRWMQWIPFIWSTWSEHLQTILKNDFIV
jgi:hypothetical protein